MAGWVAWTLGGLAVWVAVSLLSALLLTRFFALIRDTTASEYREMTEFELWATAPLTGSGFEAAAEPMEQRSPSEVLPLV